MVSCTPRLVYGLSKASSVELYPSIKNTPPEKSKREIRISSKLLEVYCGKKSDFDAYARGAKISYDL